VIARLTLLELQARTALLRARLAARTAGARRHARPPREGPLSVLMLSKYPESFAGTRYRLGIWARRLRAAGHEVRLSLAVPEQDGVRLANDWSVPARAAFHRLLLRSRLEALRDADRFDVAVIHMSDLPFWDHGPPFVARALSRLAGRVVLDLDDLPVTSGETSARPRAHDLVEAVDGVCLGTTDLLDAFPGAPAWVVPTCVDTAAWPVPDRSQRDGPVTLGWVGTPGNLPHLEGIAGPLAEACRRHGARVRVISSRPPDLPGVPVDFVPWSPEGEMRDLEPLDVGLAPLIDGPSFRRKCGLKALQYMASGLPVVASPVGANARIVDDGETGFHARTDAGWVTALDRLLGDAMTRRRLGAAGRAAAEHAWSFDAHAQRYEDCLRGVAPDRAGR
jgi:glycosyltransferase involved in cell wall biosynthesis